TLLDGAVRGVLVPEIWHLVPHATLGLIVILTAQRGPRFTLSVAALLAASTALTWRIRLSPESYGAYATAPIVGTWIAQHTDEGAMLAGWDCGIVGSYSRRRMVPLDGLINSWQYKERYLDTNSVRAFLDETGIDFIAQPIPLSVLASGPEVLVHG